MLEQKKVTKAMVMAAGVGSRLEPLTLSVPKPLIPVANRPVMDILFDKLNTLGINDVICNTYYLADQIIERYAKNNLGINFNYVKEDNLSGTAGGLKKCQYFFNKGEKFVVLSADGLTNADIEKGIETHLKSNAIATIGIKKIPHEEVSHFGVVVTDKNGYITEFQEKPSIEDAKSNYINTGIYIFDYKIFDYIPENTFYDFAKNVFPRLLEIKAINTFEISEYWTDIGTISQYRQSVKDLFDNKCEFAHSEIIANPQGRFLKGDTLIPKNTKIIGDCTIGNNCKIGENVSIIDSIIWDNVEIEDNVTIKDCVIASNCTIQTDINDTILKAGECFNKDTTKINA